MNFLLIGLFLMLLLGFLRNRRANKRKDLIRKKILERQNSNFKWEQFDNHYLLQGFSLKEINAVKKSIQDYSVIAQKSLFPEDHIYKDLLITSYNMEETEIVFELEKRLNISIKEQIINDMELVVDSYFQLIKLSKV